MICRSEQGRYGKLTEELQIYFTKVNNNYPDDTTEE